MKLENDIMIEKVFSAISRKIDNLEISSRNWFSVNQLADYLGLSKNTIYQYVSRKQIPFHKIPNSTKLIFKRIEIDGWIEGSDLKSNSKPNDIAEEIWESVK